MVRLCQKFSREILFDSPPPGDGPPGFLNPGDPMDLSNRDFPLQQPYDSIYRYKL